ncbi:DNA/RNA non-specific endonuclease [Cohnella sp. CFH 77786]|uniref:DNA/RNA non-specific endonuclease n=1 Tax=Cohnella sp. CFH 77786 TaxID=2662265 RepID=UPI001C60E57A|nr:DNA/RNA non-specific endonuclease [Cohnella sp. CFH 77786]MBW5446265.1 DNA/RNA non-specific endonuclease [Cohnella sp. CFH 77786]
MKPKAAGYDPDFLGAEFNVPHPDASPELASDFAPVSGGGTILHYTHFSIVMSKTRRLAYYTVVNIDGNRLVDVPRADDKWIFDPRIETTNQCGPELYAGNALDRGHLVRRRDPAWGDEAALANRDTFHYTNCSPQHADLNQKTWVELEDYILNHAENEKLKVTVFTGPVFRPDDTEYRGVRIPAEYWKIAVIVKASGDLSATAYLQTQKGLIGNLEFEYGEFGTYQVPVGLIEQRTGLGFGVLRKHDPLAPEARIRIATSRDIRV